MKISGLVWSRYGYFRSTYVRSGAKIQTMVDQTCPDVFMNQAKTCAITYNNYDITFLKNFIEQGNAFWFERGVPW